MQNRGMVIAGGVSFVLAALAFVLVFAYLAAHFEYPDILEGSIEAIFNGLNLYLGNYIGEFLGETALATFFLLAGLSLFNEPRFSRWLGWLLMSFAVLFGIGAFRNVTRTVQFVADVNNALLPLSMIALGMSLVWYATHSDPSGAAQ